MRKSLIILLVLSFFILNITGCDKMEQKTKITVASYNVQCLSYGAQLEQISEEIKSINPDIIGIQELDNNTRRTNYTVQIERLAQAADYKYFYFSKTIDFDGGEYGHGIMSKYPITSFETIPFTIQDSENRCFSRAEIKINNTKIVLYNTHLEFGGNIQDKQIAEIFNLAQKDEYSIITGDMNCVPATYKDCFDGDKMLSLNGGNDFTDFFNTCPEGENSYLPIDNIIVSKSFDCYYDDMAKSNLIINKTENSDHNMIYTHLNF